MGTGSIADREKIHNEVMRQRPVLWPTGTYGVAEFRP